MLIHRKGTFKDVSQSKYEKKFKPLGYKVYVEKVLTPVVENKELKPVEVLESKEKKVVPKTRKGRGK